HHLEKLTKRVNIFAKYMIHAIIITILSIFSIVIILLTIDVYMDVDANIIIVLINVLILQITLYQALGIVWIGVPIWYGICLYLKFQFDEVYVKIQVSTKLSHKYRLSHCILLKAFNE